MRITDFRRPEGTVTKLEELVPGLVVYKTYLHLFHIREIKIIRSPVKYEERLADEDRAYDKTSALQDSYWYKAFQGDMIVWASCGDFNIEEGGYNANYLFFKREDAEAAVSEFLETYGPGPHFTRDPWDEGRALYPAR